MKRKVLKINRKEGGVRGLPPGERRLGEEASSRLGMRFPSHGWAVGENLSLHHLTSRTPSSKNCCPCSGPGGQSNAVFHGDPNPVAWEAQRAPASVGTDSAVGLGGWDTGQPQPACKLSSTSSNDRFIYC